MSNKVNLNTLRLLFPVELSGEHNADLELDAHHLDLAQEKADLLRMEMFPDTAYVLLVAWEQFLGLHPEEEEPLQSRREQVVRKIRERGGLSIPYYLNLIQALGYTVKIVEPVPFMTGWGAVGDELFDEDITLQWGVEIYGQPIYDFRVGESTVGERMGWWRKLSALEALIQDLKPAHTIVYFRYL